MRQKRVLSIQDISCTGRCSLTVALPIISAAGHECAIMPTAVLSTHTGGFKGYTFRDLTADMAPISDHWAQLGRPFDAIQTGYLAKDQVPLTAGIIQRFKDANTIVLVDPAMADGGKMYPGFDTSFARQMADLVKLADITVPNYTEACFLLGEEYVPNPGRTRVEDLLRKLAALGPRHALISGLHFVPDPKHVEVNHDDKSLPSWHWVTGLIPLVVVVLMLNLFPRLLLHYTGIELASNYAIVVALVCGIVASCLLNLNQAKTLLPAINEGANGSMGAIMNTACAVGFGSVVKVVPGFGTLTNLALNMPGSILFSEAVAVNLLAGITDYYAMAEKVKQLKAEGKIEDYGRYASLDDPDECYLIIYNREGKVVAILTPGPDRLNVKTNQPDGVANYSGCGAIGIEVE